MKVVVDYDLCEANAICMEQAPEVFRVEDDDTLTVLLEDVPAEFQEATREAERLCPRQAIRLEE
mgnify:FL=1